MKNTLLLCTLLCNISFGMRIDFNLPRRSFLATGASITSSMLMTPTATVAARSPPTPKQEEIDKYLKSALPEQLAFEMFDDEADYKFDSLKFRRLDSTEVRQ